MTLHPERQYRPLSEAETATDAGAAVPFYVRAADDMTNWHANVGNFPPVYIWPANASQDTEIITAGTGLEEFVCFLGKLYLDRSYRYLHVTLQGRVKAAASSTYRVYASTNLYTGPEGDFDERYLYDASVVAVPAFTDTDWEICGASLSIPSRNGQGCIYLCMTATDTVGTASTLVSATLQPVIS